MEILSPKGHDLLRCMVDQKKKFVNHYQPLPTICERGCYVVNNYFFWGQQLSTITNNFFRSFSRDCCGSHCEHRE